MQECSLRSVHIPNNIPQYFFHISRKARDYYQLEDEFLSIQGHTLFGSFQKAQEFAKKINQKRRAEADSPEKRPVLPAQLYAAGLLHEVYHYVISVYRKEKNPSVFQKCDARLKSLFGKEPLTHTLAQFNNIFPPLPIYRGEVAVAEFLKGQTAGVSHREISIEETILLWLQNQNPALKSLTDLIDDTDLKQTSAYAEAITDIQSFFETQPTFGPENQPLIQLLLEPILAEPDSIIKQLEFIALHWRQILAESPLVNMLLSAGDYIREEDHYFVIKFQAEEERRKTPVVRQAGFGHWFEKETPPMPNYADALFDAPERFSADLNWMPRVVLIAKSSFVWLDQLTKKYQRPITRLDQIPDEELDILAARGFTSLWLIGIWRRSKASKKIKHINGNIDAVASAYSINYYDICDELGGHSAYENLRDRAKLRGVRLASDMVPNHTGIDSEWVINNPDWFIQLDHPPFPTYTYNGPDLSENDRVGIFIEDGYWTKRDAAVTFKRLDRWTGNVKYLYHGNDGTTMPWNDTAQINFLNPEAREAVIQQILHVARMFPVIRFDAAMVLAKRHIQRLWYPRPGTGGAIASRSVYGSMSQEDFDAAIPEEFWREVVDRIQKEAPDTLLLAEAFWMLEGYFVRTLGMHRVYNSAFMHMFKKEENANYRYLIKNTLEYNPQILKRYVNFMNNPDEDTAIAQFGKDDKYFGVCLMMATMPGLPMFGHGQVEGLTEKYGMEYRRAYYNEHPDNFLIARHEREIFPVLKKRYLFAEVDHFYLYDFFTAAGTVDENVFAYSNRFKDERALVVYHNKYGHTAGWVRTSVGFLEGEQIIQRSLGEALNLGTDPESYTIFRDHTNGLEYIRQNSDIWERGIYVELGAFKYHVFWNFREVKPSNIKPYDELWQLLDGKGVPSIDEAVMELSLQTVHKAIGAALDTDHLKELKEGWHKGAVKQAAVKAFGAQIQPIVSSIAELDIAKKVSVQKFVKALEEDYTGLMRLAYQYVRNQADEKKWQLFLRNLLPIDESGDIQGWRLMLGRIVFYRLNELCNTQDEPNFNVIRDWHLAKFIRQSFTTLGASEDRIETEISLLVIFVELEKHIMESGDAKTLAAQVEVLLGQPEGHTYLRTNRWNGKLWFNKERFEELLGWLFAVGAAACIKNESEQRALSEIEFMFSTMNKIKGLADNAGYDLEKFLRRISGSTLKDGVETSSPETAEFDRQKSRSTKTVRPKQSKTGTLNQTRTTTNAMAKQESSKPATGAKKAAKKTTAKPASSTAKKAPAKKVAASAAKPKKQTAAAPPVKKDAKPKSVAVKAAPKATAKADTAKKTTAAKPTTKKTTAKPAKQATSSAKPAASKKK
jgi:glycosidase